MSETTDSTKPKSTIAPDGTVLNWAGKPPSEDWEPSDDQVAQFVRDHTNADGVLVIDEPVREDDDVEELLQEQRAKGKA